ncbi:penicillin acylase family protein [Streptomyces mirabilis]|uniref:penicillin acylase family protein n=1 Tax=Streptomyces mirabilis TaxID=68239 RepID=UPI00365E0468
MLHRLAAAIMIFVGGTTGPGAGAAQAVPSHDDVLSATIRYTEYGIPHILANDYESLGFGTGYAQARDTICVIADGVVTTRGERSRFFGPDGRPDGSLSAAGSNRTSDLFFKDVQETVDRLARRPPPLGLDPQVRASTRGYVAGYNHFLRTGKITDPACKGAKWLRPITETDMFLRYWAFAEIGGQGMAVDSIVSASPPSGDAEPPATPSENAAEAAKQLLSRQNSNRGSDAIAVGRAATANHKGLLLGSPHYPWHGGLRFWQMQQTIPGELNVAGAALIGSPSNSVGYTNTMAWTITEATGIPFTLHELKLVPGDPTSYMVDGKPERMERGANRWNTRYGPVVTSLGGLSLPWTKTTAYALGDPNATNTRLPNAFAQIKRGRSVEDVHQAVASTQGLPLTNIVAADAGGSVYYGQQQVVPHVTNELAERCNTPLGRQTWPAAGLAVLDGSRTDCSWGRDADAIEPGTFGPGNLPVLRRDDYVSNFNDSYWLTNPEHPLTGFSRILGAENTQQSMRTRSGLVSVTDQLKKGPFTPRAMEQLLMANRSHAAEVIGDDLTTWCRTNDLKDACEALGKWDRRYDTGSRGALLFDRFWRKAALADGLWTVPFDSDDPVHTPRGLRTDHPALPQALREAAAELDAAGIALDAPLSDGQYVVRNGERIPVGGGTEGAGVLNKIEGAWDKSAGYTEVLDGSNYMQVVAFAQGKCPDARTLLTYSQSPNPKSPHYSDQTKLFSKERWVRARFCEGDILSSPALKVIHVSEPRR